MAFVGIGGVVGKTASRSSKCVVVREEPYDAFSLVKEKVNQQQEDLGWKNYNAAVAEERAAMLKANNQATLARLALWNAGPSEKDMLTFFGQLKNRYAKANRLQDYDYFDAAGSAAGDGGIGAMDYTTVMLGDFVGVTPAELALSSTTDSEWVAQISASAEREELVPDEEPEAVADEEPEAPAEEEEEEAEE